MYAEIARFQSLPFYSIIYAYASLPEYWLSKPEWLPRMPRRAIIHTYVIVDRCA